MRLHKEYFKYFSGTTIEKYLSVDRDTSPDSLSKKNLKDIENSIRELETIIVKDKFLLLDEKKILRQGVEIFWRRYNQYLSIHGDDFAMFIDEKIKQTELTQQEICRHNPKISTTYLSV